MKSIWRTSRISGVPLIWKSHQNFIILRKKWKKHKCLKVSFRIRIFNRWITLWIFRAIHRDWERKQDTVREDDQHPLKAERDTLHGKFRRYSWKWRNKYAEILSHELNRSRDDHLTSYDSLSWTYRPQITESGVKEERIDQDHAWKSTHSEKAAR
jgi:hypothetical protein